VSLLREIQEEAVKTDVPLSSVLRKCLILAARLNNAQLRAWVEQELNGYPDDVEVLPDYRQGGRVEVRGDLSGAFGSGLKSAPIPPNNVPEELRDNLFGVQFEESVAAYESLLSSGEQMFQVPWPADAIALLAGEFYERMNCLSAWRVISRSSIEHVLDAVRNRVLTLALELEKENPDAGEGLSGSEPIPQGRLNQIFNTTVQGSVGAFAAGSQDFTQTVEQVVPTGDTSALRQTLERLGVSAEDVDALDEALDRDRNHADGEVGLATRTWLDGLREKCIPGSFRLRRFIA
jgi:hypothetical protein